MTNDEFDDLKKRMMSVKPVPPEVGSKWMACAAHPNIKIGSTWTVTAVGHGVDPTSTAVVLVSAGQGQSHTMDAADWPGPFVAIDPSGQYVVPWDHFSIPVAPSGETFTVADPSESGVAFGLGGHETILVSDLLREVREFKALLDRHKAALDALNGHRTAKQPADLGEAVRAWIKDGSEPPLVDEDGFDVDEDGIPGQQLRDTALVDTPEGFRLTLLVDVRHEDVTEAADLLKRGRALQAAFDADRQPVKASVTSTAQGLAWDHPYVPGRVVSGPLECRVCGTRDGAMLLESVAMRPDGTASTRAICTTCHAVATSATCPVCGRDNADYMPADDSALAELAPIDPTCPGCRKPRVADFAQSNVCSRCGHESTIVMRTLSLRTNLPACIEAVCWDCANADRKP